MIPFAFISVAGARPASDLYGHMCRKLQLIFMSPKSCNVICMEDRDLLCR